MAPMAPDPAQLPQQQQPGAGPPPPPPPPPQQQQQQQQQPQQPQQQARPPPVDLSGLWAKDEARSDLAGYERILDLLGLGGLQRLTAKLIDGDAAALTVSFVTVVPFFKVTERFPFAFSTTMGRRDLRPGRQTAVTKRVDGGVRVEMTWGEPLAGSLVEEYALLPDGALRVRAAATIGSASAAADSVYARSAQSRDQLLAARERGRR
ncbi:MAG: hypothetical protein J3K34DRAFT_516468 [Monoraphidium minutum]|nr:MAG: hypothetical protein J3K34DRAFT_516468 [Monoraphidium minutum]